ELLRKESITAKLREFRLLDKLLAGARRTARRRDAREALLRTLRQGAERIPAEALAETLLTWAGRWAEGADWEHSARRLAETIRSKGWDGKALDLAAKFAAEWAAKPDTRRMLGRIAYEKTNEMKVGGFMGFAMKAFVEFTDADKLGSMIQNLLLSALADVQK